MLCADEDHAGGNNEFAKTFSGVKIYGGSKQCQGLTDQVKHGDSFNVGSIKVSAHATPCHTQDSICFFVEEDGQRAVFTGDTLFVSGCGRFFEGPPAEMHKACVCLVCRIACAQARRRLCMLASFVVR